MSKKKIGLISLLRRVESFIERVKKAFRRGLRMVCHRFNTISATE
ncbi:MAG: hypothetical protein PHY36_06665 [Methanocellales archaeon]|nr:hypothetical protein [Methanocellales archaeon]MDD4898042.1 hypothetical protein [Methanocellales archaeon]MDD5447537.1 hypothetical protein [Methanocellales archaeon]